MSRSAAVRDFMSCVSLASSSALTLSRRGSDLLPPPAAAAAAAWYDSGIGCEASVARRLATRSTAPVDFRSTLASDGLADEDDDEDDETERTGSLCW